MERKYLIEMDDFFIKKRTFGEKNKKQQKIHKN